MKSKYLLAVCAGMISTSMFLSGCGGGDDNGGASIVGTWTWSKATVSGLTLDLNNKANPLTPGGSTVITPAWITQTAAAQGTPGASVSLTATFNANNTMTLSGSATAPGEGTQTLPALPTVTWAEDSDALTITSQGVAIGVSHSVTASKLTITASWAQLQQIVADGAASQGKTPAEAQKALSDAAAQLGFTVGQISNISIALEFTR